MKCLVPYKKGGEIMKQMKDLKYHFGLKLRVYPSVIQKQMIKVNSDTFRFVYNQVVGINQKLYKLKKDKSSTEKAKTGELKKRLNLSYLSHSFFFLKDQYIDSLTKANAKQNYQKSWNLYKKNPDSKIPTFHKKNYT